MTSLNSSLAAVFTNLSASIGNYRLRIGPIEVIDGTPVVDIKPVLAGIKDF